MTEGIDRAGEMRRIGIPLTVAFPADTYQRLVFQAQERALDEETLVRLAVEAFLDVAEGSG